MATAQANYSLNIHPTEQLEKLHMENLFKSINQVEQVATDFFSKVKNKMSQIQQRLDQLEGRIVKAEAVVEKSQGQALQIKSAPCFPLANNQEYKPLIRDFINIQRQHYNYKFTENINQLKVEVSQITKQDLSDLIKIKNDMRGNKLFQTIPDFIQGHGKLQKQFECVDSLLIFDTDIIPFKTKKEQQVGEEKVEYYDLTEQPKNANTNLVDAPQSLQEKNKETNVKNDMFQFKIKPKEFHLDMPDQINVPGFGNIQGLSAMDNIPDIKIEKQKQQVQEVQEVQPPQVVETQVPTTLPKLDLKFDFEENEQTTTQEDKNDLSAQILQKKKQQGQEKKAKKSKKGKKKKRKQSEEEDEEREEGEEKEKQSENSSNEEDEDEEDEDEEEEEKPKPKIPQKPNHMEALQNQIAKFQKKQQNELSLEEKIKLNKQTSQNKQIPDKIGTAKTLNFSKPAAKNQKKQAIVKKKEESDSEQEEDSNTKDIQSLKIVSQNKTNESIQEEQKEEPIQTAKTANAPDMNSLLEQIRNPNNRKNLRPTKTVDKTIIQFQTKEQEQKTEQVKKQKPAKEKQDPQKQTREMDFLRKQITQRFQTIKKSKESESDSD